jgi:hypothetical protein
VFYFPDTQSELTVPAFEQGNFTVFTGQTHFIIYAKQEAAFSTDITVFDVLNFLPPPVSISRAASASVTQGTAAPVIIVAAGTNSATFSAVVGTLTSLNVGVGGILTAAIPVSGFTIEIMNSGVPIWKGAVSVGPIGNYNQTLCSLTGLNIPFTGNLGGLIIEVVSAVDLSADNFQVWANITYEG